MEEIRMEESREVVLTYRQADQAPAEEPVVLRYERELPERMRRREKTPPREEMPPASGPQSGARPGPPPMVMPDRPPNLWQSAIAPPEQAKEKGRWGVRLFVGLSVLVLLICLGVGIWYVRAYGWSLPGGDSGRGDAGRYPPEDDYYWSDSGGEEEETTVPRYPTGGDMRLTLTSAAGRQALTIQEIYTHVNPSVVTVLGDAGNSYSVGTGIVLSEDGYILTNHHVIAGCSSCQVWISDAYGVDATYDALLVGSDAEIDLAVLKIEGENLTAAEFGISDELVVGDPAYAIGNPLGTELRNTLTNGVVSYINRDVDVDGVTMTLIQTTAALNSGNSGGPLINQYGQVIGVNTIKMMSEYDTIEGLGFAIPSSLFVRWVNELILHGEIQPQPLLGLTISRIPTQLDNGDTGLRIEGVTPGGSGDLAGVQEGDYVVEFNGQRVMSVDQILAIRRDLYVGDEVIIRVYRDGTYLELTMVMAAG